MAKLIYRWIQAVLRAAAPLFVSPRSKLGRGLAGRRHAHEVLAEWGDAARDDSRPVAWVHAPSVGEGHLAHAVIEALREAVPGVQIVYTFFSPSADGPSRSIGVDVTTFLPWDLPGPMSKALDAIRPDVLVFTRTEVWPVLVGEARRRRVPVALIGASVPDGAGRLRAPARRFLRTTWASLDFAGAASDRDRDRLVALGVRGDAAITTGDPSFDSAVGRFDRPGAPRPWQGRLRRRERPTFVMGSTWPSDEEVLFPALVRLRTLHADLRVIVAPHEPTETRVTHLLDRLEALGWESTTLSLVGEGRGSPAAAVVVDGVGDLALLYGVADVSYVGGGFHSAGLHSVLEPAAASSPVLFGPGHGRNAAANALVEAGGAKIAGTSQEVAGVVTDWMREPAKGKDVGRRARDYIEQHVGAAERSAARIVHLMKAPHG